MLRRLMPVYKVRVMAQAIILLLVTAGEFSILEQCILDLWWIKFHCYRFISNHFVTPLSGSFHQCSIVICILILVLDGHVDKVWKPSR